jgi:outer membrane protein TolC
MAQSYLRQTRQDGRLRHILAIPILLALANAGVQAQEQNPVCPIAAGPLTLSDALRIGLEQQPALVAYRASLAAANTQSSALDRLRIPTFLVRDLPIRRQQAHLGIDIAEAGLHQAEWETVYAVTRTYYSVLYARMQVQVTQDLTQSLKFYQERVRELVNKGESREWTTSTVDKITLYLRLAQGKESDARRGIDRAKAALREAMGLPPDVPVDVVEGKLPDNKLDVTRDQVVNLALERRGEMAEAGNVSEVVQLEVDAQGKSRRPRFTTFAFASDIHARPVPQGVANDEYRPGATSLEMPAELAGRRSDRVERARDFSARAGAVVDKTRNLVALDAEDAFFKYEDAARKMPDAKDGSDAATRLAKNTRDDFRAGQKVRIEDILTNEVLAAQSSGSYNEVLFQYAIALAGLQRATAGGIDAGLSNVAPDHCGPNHCAQGASTNNDD